MHRKRIFALFLGVNRRVFAGTCEVLINDVFGACLTREVYIVFDDDHAQM